MTPDAGADFITRGRGGSQVEDVKYNLFLLFLAVHLLAEIPPVSNQLIKLSTTRFIKGGSNGAQRTCMCVSAAVWTV